MQVRLANKTYSVFGCYNYLTRLAHLATCLSYVDHIISSKNNPYGPAQLADPSTHFVGAGVGVPRTDEFVSRLYAFGRNTRNQSSLFAHFRISVVLFH